MKTKQKILNILASLVLVIYPLFFAATAVYAVPELPATPELPSTPSLPGTPEFPDTPTLPGQEQPAVNPTNSGTNDGSGHHHNDHNSAGDPSSSNSNTGADSTNNADTTVDNNTDTTIDNEADIDNIVSVDSLSGDNSSDENTGNGSVTTGNAGINGSLETNANSISLGSLECPTECETISLGDLNSSNSNTGSGSDNNASTDINNSNSTGIDNDADFNNLVDFDANSGDNSASKNTGDGTVNSGDSEVILTAINTANDVNVGYEVFNVYDDQTGDIVIDYDTFTPTGVGGQASSSNDTTGADSTNNASTDLNNTNTILIDNLGNVINNYQIDANTGNNTADKNTGDGQITTGDTNVVFNLINLLNNTFLGPGQLLLGIVNIFGNLSGDIVLQGLEGNGINPSLGSLGASNSLTGADSSNSASTDLTNNADIALANSAEVLNNVTLDATTGNNDADKNTGSGSVSTGDVNAALKVTNVANTNTIGNGGTIWMVLVNNLGTWTGQLFGGDASSGVYSPFFTFTINPDGSLSASNQNTGADSTNNANTNVSNDTDITVNNTATLANNVMIDANTGGNSASKNTGSGIIKTGDVNVAANIVNMINNNFVGGRFILTIVNVFGSFLGNIRQETAGAADITVSPDESIAISPSGVASSPNPGLKHGPTQGGLFSLGAANSASGENSNSNALVLGANDNSSGPGDFSIARFSADPSLFDGFKLEYLLIPLFAGVLVTFIRRALIRR